VKQDTIKKQQAIFCLLAKFGNALSNPKRLKIIGLLSQGRKSVEQLADMTDQSVAAASANLKVLRAAGVVVAEKEGRHVWCSVASDRVSEMWIALRNLGEELLPEVREIVRDYFEQPDTLSTLTMAEVLEELRQDRVILLDLRNRDEYLAGHLPAARHVPVSDLTACLDGLPPDKPVLAYCRGPYCLTAVNAANAHREGRIPVRSLRFGVPEWKAAGLPLDEAYLQTLTPTP
jgi:rhodanese-related sulfurtransferase